MVALDGSSSDHHVVQCIFFPELVFQSLCLHHFIKFSVFLRRISNWTTCTP